MRNARKGRMKEYDTTTKDNVVSDFASGTRIMELSRKYEIPKSTLQGWIKKAVHNHKWRIDSPNGPQSRGKCVICREEKYFDNWTEQSIWPTKTTT